jgi:uncharacterized protein (DUF2147 family)
MRAAGVAACAGLFVFISSNQSVVQAQFVQGAPAPAQAAPQPPARSNVAPPMRVQSPQPVLPQPAVQAAPGAVPVPVNPFFGVWIDHTGDGAVEIGSCNDPKQPDALCGWIVSLKSQVDDKGRPLRDSLNTDEKLRRRSICGLPVLGNLAKQASGAYDAGWIYDPRQGQSFDVELTLKSPERLQVMGYKGLKFLSKTFVWTKASGPVNRCTKPA